jgi:hypothetical protein
LAPGDLSDQTTEIGFTAFDSTGRVVWESYVAPSTRVDLASVPVDAVEMAVLLLSHRRVEKVGVFPLGEAGVNRQAPAASTFRSLAEAFVDVSIREQKTDIEIGTGEVAVLRVDGTLPSGGALDVTDSVSWRAQDPEVLDVERGVVIGRSVGQTTLHATVGRARLQVNARVKRPDREPVIVGLSGPGTLDLAAGTLNGQPIRGWNPDQKAIVADAVDMFGPFTLINGDTLVISCLQAQVFDVAITGSDDSKAPRLVVYGERTVTVSNLVNVATSSTDSNAPAGDVFLLGSDITLTGGINGDNSGVAVDLRGTVSVASAPPGRSGRLFVNSSDTVTVTAPITVSGSSGAQASAAGSIRLYGGNRIQFSDRGRLTADGGDAQQQGPGGVGGIISLATFGVVDGGNLDQPWTAHGGDGAPGQSADGGRGGEILLRVFNNSATGEIRAIQQLLADGGSSAEGTGGRGGVVEASSLTVPSVTLVRAAGGSSVQGPGGDGGAIVFPDTGSNVYQVPGGTGNPNGSDGQIVIGDNDLVIEAGQHEFDTDSGQLDGLVPIGWNPLDQSLNVTSLQIDEGATLTVTGSHAFLASLQKDAVIDGTLAFGEGVIQLSGDNLDLTGEMNANGLPTADQAGGGGGAIALSFSTLSIFGEIESMGGESSNSTSGSGGDIHLTGLNSVTINGIIDASGAKGFNAGGDGGAIQVESGGELESPGRLSCPGGEGAVSGQGGAVVLTAVSDMNLGIINCDGGESSQAPSVGGSVEISGQGDITLNGDVTVNSGNVFTPSQAGGSGGTIGITSAQIVTVLGKILSNGVSPGAGGVITINGALGVVASLTDVLALPGGSVTITP